MKSCPQATNSRESGVPLLAGVIAMARPLKDIEQELLALPQKERAELAHRLIVSLDENAPLQEDVDAAWLVEVKRRDAEMQLGKVKAIPYGEAMRLARDALKEKTTSIKGLQVLKGSDPFNLTPLIPELDPAEEAMPSERMQ